MGSSETEVDNTGLMVGLLGRYDVSKLFGKFRFVI